MNSKKQITEQKEWKQEWRMDHRKLESHQKDISKLFNFTQTIHPWNEKISKMLSDQQQSTSKVEREERKVVNNLKKINQSINQLKDTLKYYQQTHQFLHKVERMSEGIFGKLEGLKGQMANSYDQIAQIEEKLNNDLEIYDKKINFLQSGQEVPCEHGVKKIKNKENRDVNCKKQKINHEDQIQFHNQTPLEKLEHLMKEKEEDVESIEISIRELGKNLGWPQEDHSDFISIWNRNCSTKNYFQIEEELGHYFNFYTNQQIQQHMNKYLKYKKLVDKKKQLIGEYKKLKQEKKEQELNALLSSEQQNKKKVIKQQQRRKNEEEQKEMKQKVEQWKKQKQMNKVSEKKKMIQMENKRKKQERERRKQQQEKAKEMLEKWKEEKKQTKEKETVKNSVKRASSAMNHEMKQRIKQREQKLIQEKMQMGQRKRQQEYELQKKAEKIKEQKMLKFAYVNSKVDEQTKAIKQKKREKFDGKEKKEANTFGGQLVMTGVRATPSWRQGL